MKVFAFLSSYVESRGIYMKINHVNPEQHLSICRPNTLSKRFSSHLKEARPTGSIKTALFAGNSSGDGDTVSSQSRNPVLLRLPGTLQPKRSIIGSERS